ncbi:IRF3 isoform 27 [Pan troglodytes]|uniref:IRF3 isoform 27 n=4 Tax=Homininae TaxID=207598 RepID=A0A6D2WBC7_PANTR|nr:interferon regulatory factor 3 [Homo sapiens]KAI4043992.1 interferon regulatory factor 3 [Homo sapiens]PNI16338.1 IRF3 isoform 27 [Pan troglodytes]BAD89413.1 interferon regulatory factor 3 nirs variant 1 [Homo sapiens]
MGTPKPRILPWLVSQLDLGQLEGVAWVNKSRTRFRIPWKHGLRQDAQQEDFGIFQELGTFPSQTPLRTPMVEAVLLIPRKTFWMSYWVTWCWPHSQIRDPQAWL